MTEYSIGDVADRAGVANEYVVMLVELGILSSAPDGHFSEGDVRRIRLMQTLERAGMPLQGVAAAVQSGNLSLGFLDTAAYDRLASLSDVTLQEVSEKTEIPVGLLMVIREAVGFAEPQPEDRLGENELQIVPLVEAKISEGFRLTVIERWLRVYGDSLRRIAETEVDWWHTEVELPLLKSGMTPAEMIEAADSRVAQRIAPIPRPGDPRHLPRTPGAHVDEEHPRRDRGDPVRSPRSVATKPRPSSPAHCRGWCDVPRDPTGASPSSGWATE